MSPGKPDKLHLQNIKTKGSSSLIYLNIMHAKSNTQPLRWHCCVETLLCFFSLILSTTKRVTILTLISVHQLSSLIMIKSIQMYLEDTWQLGHVHQLDSWVLSNINQKIVFWLKIILTDLMHWAFASCISLLYTRHCLRGLLLLSLL